MRTLLLAFANGREQIVNDVISIEKEANFLILKTKNGDILTLNDNNVNYVVIREETKKTGKWLKTDAYPHHVYCSECYKNYVTNEEVIEGRGEKITYCTEAEFCPHCGVKMEVEAAE